MGTDKLAFEVGVVGDRTIVRDRKHVLRMCNWKLRNIGPSGAFYVVKHFPSLIKKKDHH
jgi:hypothetical protein